MSDVSRLRLLKILEFPQRCVCSKNLFLENNSAVHVVPEQIGTGLVAGVVAFGIGLNTVHGEGLIKEP